MRNIIASEAFEACVERLGGYRAIDDALEAVIDGLMRNPYGFPRFENDHVSFRYVCTKGTMFVPALYVVFRIENKDVILEHVEELLD